MQGKGFADVGPGRCVGVTGAFLQRGDSGQGKAGWALFTGTRGWGWRGPNVGPAWDKYPESETENTCFGVCPPNPPTTRRNVAQGRTQSRELRRE